MNPKTLTTILLAMLVHNGNMKEEEAIMLINAAGTAFDGLVLDDMTLPEMVEALDNPQPRPKPAIETPDTPKLIIPE